MKLVLNRYVRAALLPLVFALAGDAYAHVTLESRSAEAGSTYKAVFKVGHGCAGSPVRQIVVDIPDGVQGAKPMPKAGWQIEIEQTRLDRPYTSHGKSVAEDVTQVRWMGGPLPDAYYDEFVLVAKLPERVGMLYWKVSQVCEQGRIDWAELPAAGSKLSDYRAPAAALEVVPKTGAEHSH